ncbi:MAG TPA: hypothetical protein VFH47_04390 [Candidatus Thermoplasmatota archaeon]|nr:hypothetical protein [Candidatus Thermoplasmatota archaeon]
MVEPGLTTPRRTAPGRSHTLTSPDYLRDQVAQDALERARRRFEEREQRYAGFRR